MFAYREDVIQTSENIKDPNIQILNCVFKKESWGQTKSSTDFRKS